MAPLRIALFGASGMIGSRIAAEATRRGHHVTHIGRAQADALDPASVAKAAAGHDVLASAYSPPPDEPEILVPATKSLLVGAERARVKRIVAVGGAGSLKLPDGTDAVDAPGENPYRAIGLAHREALRVYRASNAPWTVLSPNGAIAPGARTGKFRLGADHMLFDANGQPHISAEDFAVAFVDELEQPKHLCSRFTVGY